MTDLSPVSQETLALLAEHQPISCRELFEHDRLHDCSRSMGRTLGCLKRHGAVETVAIGDTTVWRLTAHGERTLRASDGEPTPLSPYVGSSRPVPAVQPEAATPAAPVPDAPASDLDIDEAANLLNARVDELRASPAPEIQPEPLDPILETAGIDPVDDDIEIVLVDDITGSVEELPNGPDLGDALYAGLEYPANSKPLPVIDSDLSHLDAALAQLDDLLERPDPGRNIHDLIEFNRAGAEKVRQRGGHVAAAMMESTANALARFAGAAEPEHR